MISAAEGSRIVVPTLFDNFQIVQLINKYFILFNLCIIYFYYFYTFL